MEVCGGHTHTIYKHGLEDYLPEAVPLVHGPGCPVCVIPMGRVDDAIAHRRAPRRDHDLVRRHDAGARAGDGSFFDAKAAGADIRMVYSPLDALKIARQNPDKRRRVHGHRVRDHRPVDGDDRAARGRARASTNFSVFCNHVTIIPADQGHPGLARPAPRRVHRPRPRLDGDRLPALRVHRARRTASRWSCAGFEPLDILQSVYQLLRQLAEGRCEVENQYGRVVPWDGNPRALR